MPEIKKNLEPNLNSFPQREILPIEKEEKQIENIPNLEKTVEKNIFEEGTSKENDRISNQQVSDEGQKISDNPMNNRLRKAIDDILEEGLEDIYLNLSKEEQKEFKIKGEETTVKISGFLGETRVKVKKIVQVIIDWLRLVPGINKFFVKQTAKIKTDKILKIKDQENNESEE